jgi:hypothetical protein
VDLNRWELVLVIFVDDCSQLGKMLADLSCAVPNDQVEFVQHFFEKLVVALDVLKQRLRREHDLELLLGLDLGLFASCLRTLALLSNQ